MASLRSRSIAIEVDAKSVPRRRQLVRCSFGEIRTPKPCQALYRGLARWELDQIRRMGDRVREGLENDGAAVPSLDTDMVTPRETCVAAAVVGDCRTTSRSPRRAARSGAQCAAQQDGDGVTTAAGSGALV